MFGVVWVSLICMMYWTEVRKTEVIGSNARQFSLAGCALLTSK
jgi:NNP family nitrate/nitrite transporter-like MFS transporter